MKRTIWDAVIHILIPLHGNNWCAGCPIMPVPCLFENWLVSCRHLQIWEQNPDETLEECACNKKSWDNFQNWGEDGVFEKASVTLPLLGLSSKWWEITARPERQLLLGTKAPVFADIAKPYLCVRFPYQYWRFTNFLIAIFSTAYNQGTMGTKG